MNSPKAFEDFHWVHFSLLNLNPFLFSGRHISRACTKVFGKAAHGCLPHFQKDSMQRLETCRPTGRRELHSQFE
jgi:hypothetical protein